MLGLSQPRNYIYLPTAMWEGASYGLCVAWRWLNLLDFHYPDMACLVGASNDAFGEIPNQPRLEYGINKLPLMSVSPLWDHF